jgi:competence protein ComEC
VPTRAGQALRIGTLRIRILSPGPRAPGPAPADPNPRATVAVVSSGAFDLFLSADAESPSLLPLALPRVEAMKVPHHGSADDGLARLLDRLRPAIAAIEVGRGNAFGHPRPSTLATLEARVPNVFRTDRDGTVELALEGGALRVRTHR